MISKICNWIGTIPVDKLLHFIVAYILFDLFLTICLAYNISNIWSIIISLIIISALIFAKEFIDKTQVGNYFSWGDIIAGYIGVIINLIIHICIK